MLRVIQAFGGHSTGDDITDPAEIEAVLASDQAHFVVAVAEPEAEPADARTIAAPATDPQE